MMFEEVKIHSHCVLECYRQNSKQSKVIMNAILCPILTLAQLTLQKSTTPCFQGWLFSVLNSLKINEKHSDRSTSNF